MIFRIYHELQGRHVHCSMFVGKSGSMTLAKAGDFVLNENEFYAFKELLNFGMGSGLTLDEVDFQNRHSSKGPAQ